MKKLVKLVPILLLGVLLVGCQPSKDATDSSSKAGTEESTKEIKGETFTITLNEDDKEIVTKELSFKEGDFLQDVMTENFEIGEENGMISSIDGHEKNDKEQKYWLYEVNGEQPTVGAAEYVLKADDKIVWDLKKLDAN